MTVEFEITAGGETGILEGFSKEGCDIQQFIAGSFAKVGKTMEFRGVKVQITRIIKFVF